MLQKSKELLACLKEKDEVDFLVIVYVAYLAHCA